MKLWADHIGNFIENCVDNGVKNHMVQSAQWVICQLHLVSSSLLILVVVFFHVIKNPSKIISSGSNLSSVGINIVDKFLIGFVHDSILPDVTAIIARKIIGRIIGNSSLMLICGVHSCGEHSVATLNRTEYALVTPTLIKASSMTK
jgi:hypothetical protein